VMDAARSRQELSPLSLTRATRLARVEGSDADGGDRQRPFDVMDAARSRQLLSCPELDVTRAYYDEVLRRGGPALSDAIEVRLEQRDESSQWPVYKSVHAKRRFESGDIVFVEDPLVLMQHVHNDVPCCSVCLRFVDDDVCCLVGTRFCAECRRSSTAYRVHRRYMCLSPESGCGPGGARALEAFYAMAEQTNDVFVLAGKLLADVMYAARASALEEAWRPYSMGFKMPWWVQVARPEDVPEDEEEEFRGQLKELAEDAFELFCAVVSERNGEEFRRYSGNLLSLDVWGSVVGMFELNNLSILARGPTATAAGEDDEDDEDDERDDALVEGSGFYRIHSCFNHSCDPNCRVLLPRGDHENAQAIVQATRTIASGEELLVSYCEEDDPIEERHRALQDYGFACQCGRCVLEQEFC